MENVRFYKCKICGNIIGLISGNAGSIKCCGEQMEQLSANSVDAATEKHIPVYEVDGNEIIVRVGSVEHPMDPDHYISWIAIVSERETTRIALKPGEKPEVRFKYIKGATLYAYCNKHGLWKSEVV